ncbi:MAG TPA: OmpW family outer membrane protein [Burkholderiaceae bacterium]|nr:OmpW family outer membrane protein [Burkholderiaceae bacterium]
MNTRKSPLAAALLAATLMVANFGAQAQEQALTLGLAFININSKASDLRGPFTPPGANLKVDDATTLVFSYSRRVNDRYSLELALGVPPKHDVQGTGALAGVGKIAEVKQFSPTMFVNYSFADPKATVQPFVGVGFNYTSFFAGRSTPAGSNASGGPTSITLTDSFGLAAQAGLNWRIDERWFASAKIATAQVKSDLTSNSAGLVRTSTIDFRPVVFAVSGGYRF